MLGPSMSAFDLLAAAPKVCSRSRAVRRDPAAARSAPREVIARRESLNLSGVAQTRIVYERDVCRARRPRAGAARVKNH